MANVKEVFGGATAITVSIASLADGGARESASVDNSTNLFLDALVQVKVKTGAGALGSDKNVYVYAAGSYDGTQWPDAVTGADAGITLNSPTQLRLLGTIYCAASATTYISEPFAVAQCFGGVLPSKWGIVIQNKTGTALDTTEGNHSKNFNGVYASVV